MAKNNKYVVKKTFRKRVIIILLVLILTLVALAVPIVSSLELASEYVNIDTDILAIPDLFEGDLGFGILTDNWDTWVLAVFMLAAAILVLKLLVAVLLKSRRRFMLASFVTLILAVAYLASTFSFDLEAIQDAVSDIGTFLGDLSYGVYAMIGCPLLAFILSPFAYRKIK